jgi:ElaB/YqjD/DUF883 family membrane-anchored ribosome-binding protein
MKSELLNYKPEFVEYVLDDVVAETFPKELDFLSLDEGQLMGDRQMKSKRDVLNFIGKHFTAQFPNDEFAVRKMTDVEIDATRAEYCALTEDLLPVRKAELEEAIEKAKKLKMDAEEAVAAVKQDIEVYAAQVKKGTKELLLKSKDTFCIALAGYYLVYTWDETKQTFVLANGYEVTDQSEIFANDTKNREMLMSLWGMEFPEIRRKLQTDDDDDIPFGSGHNETEDL